MVGHRGIEPRNTCVSGRPRRPAGSWPAASVRFERTGLFRPAAFGAAAIIHSAKMPSCNRHLTGGWWTDRTSAGPCRPDLRFPAGHLATRSTIHARKVGDSNATALTAHRLAGEPGTPVRFTFRSAPRTRTGITRGLNALALPIGLERLTSDRPDSNRPCDLGKVTC